VSADDIVTITSTILYIIATRWAWIAHTCYYVEMHTLIHIIPTHFRLQ
jgi:hypothetical protein